MSSVIKGEEIWKIYKNGGVGTVALKDVSFDIKKGEMLGILGQSGSGKSTLLHIIGLLDDPTKGKLYINGINTQKMDEDEKAKLRLETIGFVFQAFNLLPGLTAYENALLPMVIKESVEKEYVEELFEKFNIAHRMEYYPNQLSGGERQRVAIIRALANKPSVILADEPTGNLDSKNGNEVLQAFEKVNKEFGTTVVIVTHDQDIVKNMDRIIKLKDGMVIE
ncbi:MAG: ABC transporter ATP-binding protein [Candidatus Anstonellales archaeon]